MVNPVKLSEELQHGLILQDTSELLKRSDAAEQDIYSFAQTTEARKIEPSLNVTYARMPEHCLNYRPSKRILKMQAARRSR